MVFQDTGVNTVNITQLKNLIQQGESQHLEFKKSTTQIKPAFETACAFLNNKGGTILIGVKDNGQLIGQEITDQTKQLIAHESRKIEPKSNEEIIVILNKEESMTTSSIKQQLNNPPSDRTLRYELANLKEKGIIKSSGSTKTTVWSVVKKTNDSAMIRQ